MADVGRPDALQELRHIGVIIHDLLKFWADHTTNVADVLEENRTSRGFPVLKPSTPVINALRQLNCRNIHPLPLQELLQGSLAEATGTETGFWPFKCAMAGTEYELDSISTMLIGFERMGSKLFGMCSDSWKQALAIEKSALLQEAVRTVDQIRRDEETLLSKEERLAEKDVAKQELKVLTILCVLSERGINVARQRLITEFFDVA